MRPFRDRRIDGTPRYSSATFVPKKPRGRARRSNGKMPFDGRTSQARRYDDLMVSFLADHPEPTEAALGLARAAALASMRLDRIEELAVKGEEVDDALFVRMAGSLARSLRALRMLKPKAQSAGTPGPSALARHLAALAERPAPTA
jgi:hypothetical protein